MTQEDLDVETGEWWSDLVGAGQVTPVTAAALARSQAVLHGASTDSTTSQQQAKDPRNRRARHRALVPVLAAAAAVAVAFSFYLAQEQGPSGDVLTPAVAAPQLSGATRSFSSASCVEEYGVTSLAHRDFAFDGTVVSATATPTEAEGYVAVTFHVNEWFRGGTGPTATISMSAAGDGTRSASQDPTSEWGPEHTAGTRLLVSGELRWGGAPLDDAVAWTCGFTRFYDATTAAGRRQVFSD